MSISQQMRYRIYFGLMIVYMATACIVACALLWKISVTEYRVYGSERVIEENVNLVPICEITKELENDPYLNCSLLDGLVYEKFVANGWTKIVHSAKLNSQQYVAIKSVNLKGKDINDCVKTEPVLLCHNKAVGKLVREINLLKVLNHETIIQLKYHCSKTSDNFSCMKYAVLATEIGEPLTNLKLLLMTWNERKQLIQDLASLIHYAQQNSYGILGFPDLRRPQFVLINGRLKLADLDDAIIGEPSCTKHTDCSNLNTPIQCISSICDGYNSKLNIQKSFKEFGPYIFLLEGVPEEKKMKLNSLRQMWQSNNVTTKQLVSNAMLL